MKSSSTTEALGRKIFTLICAATLCAACGAQPSSGEEVQVTELPITGGWTTLNLINGWSNYNTNNAPAVGIVNGVITFRGAIKGSSTASNVPFILSSPTYSPFWPNPANRLFLRNVMRNSSGSYVGGMMHFMPLDDGDGYFDEMELYQDGTSGAGAAAKNFTSLDGISYDRSVGEPVIVDYSKWQSIYGQRQSEGGCSGCSVYVKLVDGFVQLQGFVSRHTDQLNNFDGFLGTLPSAQYIPGNRVIVPINFGNLGTSSWGTLIINTDGTLYLSGSLSDANNGTSLEGVWYSKTLVGNSNLPLNTAAGWQQFGARTVKYGKYGDVVRFQGGVTGGGPSTVIATLPAGFRPPTTVRLVAVSWAITGVATIIVAPDGTITYSGPTVNGGMTGSSYISLDGVSFAL